MLKNFLIIIFIFVAINGAIAQQEKVEELEQITLISKKPVEKISAEIKLADIYQKTSKLKAIYYLEEALKLTEKHKLDSLKCEVIYRIARTYGQDEKTKAKEYYLLYLKTNSKEKNISNYSKVYNNLGRLYLLENKFDSAEYYFRGSIKIKKKMAKLEPNNHEIQQSIGISLSNLGTMFLNQSDYKQAIETLYEALEVFQDIGDTNTMAVTSLNIGVIYYYYKDIKNASITYTKALKLARISKNKAVEASALTNLGGIENENQNLDRADSLYNAALKIRLEIGPESSIAGLYENLGIIAQERGDFRQALTYLNKSLNIKIKENNDDALASLYANLGNLYHREKNYFKAKESLLKALEYANKSKSLEKLLQINKSISIVYEDQKDYVNALIYYREYKLLDDSIHSLKSEETINLFKQKYKTAEQDRTIAEFKQKQELAILNQEKQSLNNRLLFALILILLIVSAAIIYIVNNKRKADKLIFQKNNEMSQQKMLELVKEQEMKSVNSFISGQEKERSRIAADLHDRLGSLLSTVKLHFSSIEPSIENDHELAESFSYAVSLLDQSVAEVRSVSRNLAKEILTDFGIVGAIDNLQNAINSAGNIKLVFINSGFNIKLKYEFEIEIYRIIQELVTNAIKHSGATELVIQFVLDENNLSITIEDNGVGFNIDKVNKKGLGLANIFDRASKMKGRYSYDSSPGNGTSFFVEIPLLEAKLKE